jgi:hypothetical protein
MRKAFDVYRDALTKDPAKGWNMLMDADKFSARAFLLMWVILTTLSLSLGLTKKRPPLKDFKTVKGSNLFQGEKEDTNPVGGPGFNFNTVEWLETFKGWVNLVPEVIILAYYIVFQWNSLVFASIQRNGLGEFGF